MSNSNDDEPRRAIGFRSFLECLMTISTIGTIAGILTAVMMRDALGPLMPGGELPGDVERRLAISIAPIYIGGMLTGAVISRLIVRMAAARDGRIRVDRDAFGIRTRG